MHSQKIMLCFNQKLGIRTHISSCQFYKTVTVIFPPCKLLQAKQQRPNSCMSFYPHIIWVMSVNESFLLWIEQGGHARGSLWRSLIYFIPYSCWGSWDGERESGSFFPWKSLICSTGMDGIWNNLCIWLLDSCIRLRGSPKIGEGSQSTFYPFKGFTLSRLTENIFSLLKIF